MKQINWGRGLASMQIVFAVGASIGYFFQKDYRRAVYWMAAAILTAAVTF